MDPRDKELKFLRNEVHKLQRELHKAHEEKLEAERQRDAMRSVLMIYRRRGSAPDYKQWKRDE